MLYERDCQGHAAQLQNDIWKSEHQCTSNHRNANHCKRSAKSTPNIFPCTECIRYTTTILSRVRRTFIRVGRIIAAVIVVNLIEDSCVIVTWFDWNLLTRRRIHRGELNFDDFPHLERCDIRESKEKNWSSYHFYMFFKWNNNVTWLPHFLWSSTLEQKLLKTFNTNHSFGVTSGISFKIMLCVVT